MNKIQACSVCATETPNFMMLVGKTFSITMCQDCWIEFTDKAPMDVLESLFKVEWRSAPEEMGPPPDFN